MNQHVGTPLGWGKKLMLSSAAVTALLGPLVLGIFSVPVIRMQAQPLQTTGPEFEVATIKVTPADNQGFTGLGGGPGGLLTIRHYTVKQMLKYAYTLHPDQIVGGPSWLDETRYDIDAKMPAGVGGEANIKVMLRKLVAARFQLSFHTDTRQMQAYVLTVARGGPMMKERKAGDGGAPYSQYFAGPKLPGRNISMAQFAMGLQGLVMDRPVIDHTGLTATYDFDLSWTPDETQFAGRGGTPPYVGAPDGPSIFAALQDQLGLRLEGTWALVEVLIVDRVERPGEN